MFPIVLQCTNLFYVCMGMWLPRWRIGSGNLLAAFRNWKVLALEDEREKSLSAVDLLALIGDVFPERATFCHQCFSEYAPRGALSI